ncbi:MAG: hypothetical protein ACKPKO_02390, partial [Candidatus Fonsibacter sp.]
MIVKLSNPSLFKKEVIEREHTKILTKYKNATPITGRLKRETEEPDQVEIIDADYSNARSYITFRFINNDNNVISEARRRVFSNMLKMHQNKIDNAVSKAFNH